MMILNDELFVRIPSKELSGILVHFIQNELPNVERYDFKVSQLHLSAKFTDRFGDEASRVATLAISEVQNRYGYCAEYKQGFSYIFEDGRQELFYLINDRNLVATCLLVREAIMMEECFIND